MNTIHSVKGVLYYASCLVKRKKDFPHNRHDAGYFRLLRMGTSGLIGGKVQALAARQSYKVAMSSIL
jgi:hypothetical protein